MEIASARVANAAGANVAFARPIMISAPTDRSRKIIAHTPMRRFGVPEDLLGRMLWLVDERTSGFVTGIVVPVDGGFMSYSGV